MTATDNEKEKVREQVRQTYGSVAETADACCSSGCCGPVAVDSTRLGYSTGELESVPAGAESGSRLRQSPGHRRAARRRDGARSGLRCRLRLLPGGAAGRPRRARHRRRHDAGDARQGARQRPARRHRQRRVPARRDRGPAGGRQQRGRDHVQLRHQSVAGQAAGLPGMRSGCSSPADGWRSQTSSRRPRCPTRCATIRTCSADASRAPRPLRRSSAGWPAAGFDEVRVDLKPESREMVRDWFPGRGVEDYVCSATIVAFKPGNTSAGPC